MCTLHEPKGRWGACSSRNPLQIRYRVSGKLWLRQLIALLASQPLLSTRKGLMCYRESADGGLLLLSTCLLMCCRRARNEQLGFPGLSPRGIKWTTSNCAMPQMLWVKLSPGKGKPLWQVWDTEEPSTALHNIRAAPLPELKQAPELGNVQNVEVQRAGLVLAVRRASLGNFRGCFRALANTSWVS